MAFTAGQQVRGPELRRAMAGVGLADGDTQISNTIDMEPVAGTQVTVEPRTIYALDGFIAYSAGTTCAISFAINAPLDVIGDWALYSLNQATVTDSVGALRVRISNGMGADDVLPAAGSSVESGAQVALVRGSFYSGVSSGAIQLLFTQLVAGVDATTVAAGTWLRLTKIGDI